MPRLRGPWRARENKGSRARSRTAARVGGRNPSAGKELQGIEGGGDVSEVLTIRGTVRGRVSKILTLGPRPPPRIGRIRPFATRRCGTPAGDTQKVSPLLIEGRVAQGPVLQGFSRAEHSLDLTLPLKTLTYALGQPQTAQGFAGRSQRFSPVQASNLVTRHTQKSSPEGVIHTQKFSQEAQKFSPNRA